ncbi:MAG: hypothetical protein JNN15_06730 [Blastocatellia bacterium]|nr:hypothetical protein [Blastocatellia bacterium]
MKLRRFFSLLLLCLSIAFAHRATLADTLKLKSGEVVKGRVISYNNNIFTVEMKFGSFSKVRASIDVRDIETIEFDGQSDTQTSSNTPAPSPTVRPPQSSPASSSSTPTTSKSSPPSSPYLPTATSTPVTTASRPPATNPKSDPLNNDDITTETPTSKGKPATTIPTIPRDFVVTVPAKDDWTYANISVKRGDKIQLNATGKVKLSSSKESGPDGISLDDKNKLILDKPTGSLIAVIGDENDDFIYIGNQKEFIAARDGKLFLSINEGDISDNEGAFTVRVRVEPSK